MKRSLRYSQNCCSHDNTSQIKTTPRPFPGFIYHNLSSDKLYTSVFSVCTELKVKIQQQDWKTQRLTL